MGKAGGTLRAQNLGIGPRRVRVTHRIAAISTCFGGKLFQLGDEIVDNPCSRSLRRARHTNVWMMGLTMQVISHMLCTNSSLAPHQSHSWSSIDEKRILTVEPHSIPTRPRAFLRGCGGLEESLLQSMSTLTSTDAHIPHEIGESPSPLHQFGDQTPRNISRAEHLKPGPITGPVRPQDVISHEKDCHSFYCSFQHDRRSTCCRRRRYARPVTPEGFLSNSHTASPWNAP